MGTGQKSVGSRLWDVPVWLGSGQEGSPLVWPHQPKPTQEMPTDLNIRAPNLLWLAGSTRLPELSSWQYWLEGTMTLVLGGCPVPVLSPVARGAGQTCKRPAGREGARRCPGWRPLRCCWDTISCSFEENCEGSSPPLRPRKETGGQTVVNAGPPLRPPLG